MRINFIKSNLKLYRAYFKWHKIFFWSCSNVNVRRCEFFGHVNKFWSYSFGHLESGEYFSLKNLFENITKSRRFSIILFVNSFFNFIFQIFFRFFVHLSDAAAWGPKMKKLVKKLVDFVDKCVLISTDYFCSCFVGSWPSCWSCDGAALVVVLWVTSRTCGVN